jgi:hypothetical protein
MKKLILLAVLFFVFAGITNAQGGDSRHKRWTDDFPAAHEGGFTRMKSSDANPDHDMGHHKELRDLPDAVENSTMVDNALFKIETAIQKGDVKRFEEMLASTVTLRLEDSLYLNISDMAALDLLKNYFRGMKSVKFNFDSNCSGILKFEREDGAKKSEYVDVVFGGDMNVLITAMNMSNYSKMTAFCKYIKRDK